MWALRRDPEEAADRVPETQLWVVGTQRGVPRLRIYLRSRAGVPDECELVWIEDRF
jgi:hypothetical protein